MTAVDGPPASLLTHIALPVRDMAAMLAFYRRYTTMKLIHERTDDDTGFRSVWLANERDITEHGARFVIVLFEGPVPSDVVRAEIKEQYGFLTPFSHLGVRTSVVSGNRVSVRVNLGVRRTFKKKPPKKPNYANP